MKKQLGFSLVELIIIIAIIGTLSVIAIPNFSKYLTSLELNNSTKQLIGKIKIAQQNTVTEQVVYSLRMSILGNSYFIVKTEPVEEILETHNLDDNVVFHSFTGIQNNEVVFNPAGAVEFSGTIILEHQTSLKQTRINIKPSGYLTWETIN